MEIHVSLTTGEIYTFDIDVEPNEFLSKIKPKEVFQRAAHQILGKIRTVTIMPGCIEWIELDTMDLPPQAPFAKSLTIRQLSAATFKDRVNKEKDMIMESMKAEGSKNVLMAYGMGTFRSGKTLYFELRGRMEREEDRISHSQKIFSMPALFVYGETSGLYLVNTQNITVWQVVPGLRKSTFFALKGELISTKKSK